MPTLLSKLLSTYNMDKDNIQIIFNKWLYDLMFEDRV